MTDQENTAVESAPVAEAPTAAVAAPRKKAVKKTPVKKAAAKKATAKKTAKKATAKKATKTAKKKAVSNTAGEGQYGIDRPHDLPWNEKKVAVFKGLKKLRATSKTNATSANAVVDVYPDVLSQRDVRHYCYHAKAAGLIDVATVEGVRGHAFYLTAKGANVDPAKALKEQNAGK